MKRYERIPAASSIQTRNQTIRALLESAIRFSYNASKVVPFPKSNPLCDTEK